MCNYVSGIITISDKEIISTLGGTSHSEIRDALGIPDNELVEWEWELDCELEIRVRDNRKTEGTKETEQFWMAYFLSQYPNRNAVLARFGKEHKAYWLDKVTNYGWELCRVPGELRTLDVCLAAVTNDGLALGFVPKELRECVKKNVGMKIISNGNI